MAQVNVTINGRSFRMACDDGEEERLEKLAARFNGWIDELRGAFGEIGDQRLTVMAGIMATDQLTEMERRLARAEEELASAQEAQAVLQEGQSRAEKSVVAAVDEAAAKIEALAQGLSKSLKSN
ncbi:cell division protein ZapA [Roseibium sp.]|uniref:cell division protein ZapA n=1 Tax=Roseibium sp. TaxID=1936156 RepID=UPI003A976B0B